MAVKQKPSTSSGSSSGGSCNNSSRY